MSDPQQPLKESQTSLSESLEVPESSNSTNQTTPMSPTPTTVKPGNSLSLTRGGRDGALTRTRKNQVALDNVESHVGGREMLIDTLAMGTLDKKQEHFLRLLCDPARMKDSVVTIARDAGLNPLQVLDMLRDSSKSKGTSIALTYMSEALPDVAADIIDKSVDAKVECPHCFGEGFVDQDVKCPQCLGRGEIFRPSDIDRQKMIADYTGLAPKKTGMNINMNQQVGVVNPGNFFSKYVKQSDEAAYDVQDVIDVKPEEPSGS